MKVLTRVALLTSLVMSGHAMALQTLNDGDMSAATGQDGLTLTITPPTTGLTVEHLYLHDKDGLTGVSGSTAVSGGAISLGAGATQVKVNTNGNPITVKVDADGGASGTAPVLNVNIGLPSAMTISTGDIAVVGSNRSTVGGTTVTSTTRGVKATGSQTILSNMDINLGGAAVNLQLGNQPQGALVKLSGALTGGLNINGITVNDTTGGGSIKVGKLFVTDTGSTSTLTLNDTIKATTNGLEIQHLGSAMDVFLEDVRLGNVSQTSSSIGDVELVGLNLANTKIAITGH